ncbi:MAG: hypothetical protein DLM65_15450 [Candidatus Aeolococcus gillhamiae]|uniref:Peptidase M41 domain-containing protein n=1 Tax=Candidatus Aeolococcus gillhamiae TaxID=3127015 RepID=A0A2W6A1L6_9BACT|nr:MAG: hypothetical protein DLM65_15450 [Candidatus Dormibacter sp. RRmetagenome_bin12]
MGDEPGCGSSQLFRGRRRGGLGVQRPYSDATALVIDAEVKRISDECLAQAVTLLTTNRGRLDALASALLERDTLYEAEILRVADVRQPQALAV